MKITMTKDGTVSFLQMTPALAATLVDLASDLADGAMLVYPDGERAEPDERVKRLLAKVGDAYDKPTALIGDAPDWTKRWRTT